MNSMVMRGHCSDGYRLVIQLDPALRTVNLAHRAARLMRLRGGVRLARGPFEARDRGGQARLRIDQELAGKHHLVARLQALADLGLAAGFGADLQHPRP